MLNLSYILEVNRIWDPKTFHLVGVAPLLKVLLEGSPAPVGGPTADLTLEFLA